MKLTKRQFMALATSFAFMGLAKHNALALEGLSENRLGYGPLIPDPEALIDLPEGFSYRIISRFGDVMTDGFQVPDNADGMGCFKLDDHRVTLVRNHELNVLDADRGSAPDNRKIDFSIFDHRDDGTVLPGGTTTIVYNLKTDEVEKEFVSLLGTIRNCAGGVTPWGSWLTCEENVTLKRDGVAKDHGWVFEVPAGAEGPIDPVPLKDMGRFNHEAAAVDPRTGIVYLTEDRNDSLFYRFIPNTPGKLESGGKLQALGFAKGASNADTRNWDLLTWNVGDWADVVWIDLNDVHSPNDDDLRIKGQASGAAIFARGEGIHWGDNELFFCCTSGGQSQLGQIMRYKPSAFEGMHKEGDEPGQLQLFLESDDPNGFNFGDNLTVAPNGHLFVCEDQYTEKTINHIRGVTREGKVYDFAKVRIQSESAGACFSPDGSTLFVNIFSPTRTLAITGPWLHL
jgi:secreted PhoX family phosphatase